MNLREALDTLDPSNDEHWTADGLPLVSVVAELVGNTNIKRADITNFAPDFTREVVEAKEAPDAESSAEGETPEEGSEKTEEAEEVVTHDGQGDFAASEPEPEGVKTLLPAEPKSEHDVLSGQLAERTREMLGAQSAQEKAKQLADRLANEVNAINRRMDLLLRTDPNHATAGIRDYIRQQNVNRMQRARGLRRFIEVSGVHPADVSKAVDPKAPIDRAMAQRKPARGTARPVHPRH